eukprot:TRINITY_DN310_c0_g1_i1.p3 TRINITY_DN310_c0_g1~~TRINITY_DN310_c0_g1_i1.p3  ORF type:complete len:128 (+),score=15.72 TRINITY_DN310_c0_g1_i1:305-688(+)
MESMFEPTTRKSPRSPTRGVATRARRVPSRTPTPHNKRGVLAAASLHSAIPTESVTPMPSFTVTPPTSPTRSTPAIMHEQLKATPDGGSRYAAGSWQTSPPPSALPKPSFMDRPISHANRRLVFVGA